MPVLVAIIVNRFLLKWHVRVIQDKLWRSPFFSYLEFSLIGIFQHSNVYNSIVVRTVLCLVSSSVAPNNVSAGCNTLLPSISAVMSTLTDCHRVALQRRFVASNHFGPLILHFCHSAALLANFTEKKKT